MSETENHRDLTAQTPRNFGRLPLSIVLRIVFEGFSNRKVRTALTLAGIILATAFLMLVWSRVQPGPQTADERALKRWLVGLSLLVCTMGIANSVLMSVTDRFREIGTMKCLGASDRLIVYMFLLESLWFGLLGGLAGSSIGLAAARMSAGTTVSWGPMIVKFLLVILISSALSVIATIIPAGVAAKMTPMDAMRPLK